MKLNRSAWVMVVAAGTLWAQAPATPKAPATPRAPATASGAMQAPAGQKPAAKATAKPAAKPMAAAPAATAKKPAAATPFAAKPKPAAKKAEGAPAPAAAAAAKPAGKRDPFVSPVISRMSGPEAGCATGKRCLVINQITLKGIAKTPHGWVAMVENPAQKAYFLYENDPLFDGFVEKITVDSVIFRENVMDSLGHQSTREVVKRVTAPAV